ncbi:MAG: YfhO family protein, partial [bacterium]|nr:YfhO family protein [bacterium]
YIISDDPTLSDEYPDLMLVHSGGFQIYERDDAALRWYLSDFALTGQGGNGGEVKIDWPGYGIESGNSEPGNIILAGETPSRLEFEIHADRDCWMVLSDTWHPQWAATIDGEKSEIYKANGAYRAVKIPAGKHSLIFEYQPRDFQTGLFISVLSIFMLLVIATLETMRVWRNQGPQRIADNA